jgi:phospholipase C
MPRTRTLIATSLALLLGLALALAGCGAAAQAPSQPQARNLQHIFVIMMENHSTSEIVGNTADAPYINQLASQYGVALNYYGVTHPSLPNYLSAISGDYQGIWDDCGAGPTVTCQPSDFVGGAPYNGTLLTAAELASASSQPHLFDKQTIVDQLEAQHLTWKAYMESMPSSGFLGETNAHKLYAVKHNPFVYFKDIYNNHDRLQRIVPFTQFGSDLSSTSVPNFLWISPNQCNDMHGLSPANAQAENVPQCGYPASGLDHGAIQTGDKFLSTLVPQIMHSKAWSEGAAIVIAWDEDDYSGYAGCCHSPTGVNGTVLGGANAPVIVISSKVTHHIQDSTTPYNHYSLLATIEKVWGFPCLANACGFSDDQLMTRFFLP